MPHTSDEEGSLNEVGGHCPKCGAEYRPGFRTCADCGVSLIPGPAPELDDGPLREPDHSWMDEPGEVHPVAVAALPWEEAWLLAGRLRAEGIPSRVYPDYVAGFISLAQGIPQTRASLDRIGLGRSTFEVIVPEEYANEARKIVDRYRVA